MKSAARAVHFVFYGKLKQISRFSLVGVANTLIDFFTFTLCHGIFGASYGISQIVGYSFGVANSFICNRKWTFRSKNAEKKTLAEFAQFILVNLVSLSITIIVMRFLVGNMNLNVYISKVLVTLIAQVTNFLGYRLWVFR